MEIAKLFARVGVKADSGQLNSFTKGIGQAASGLLKLVGVAAGTAGAVMALKKFTNEAMQTALSLQNFSAETGVSAESLQRWKAVADQVSGSGQAVEAAITSIAKNREALQLGEGNLSPYQLLGIDPMQDPIKVLEDLRKETARLPQAMKANIIQQMGLSSDLIPMLELTNEQFAEMSGRAYVMPQSAINSLNSTRQSLTELGQAGKYFQGLIATGLAPGLKKFTDSLNQWLRQNPQVIEGIKKIGEGIGRALVAITRAVSMIGSLVSNTIGWKNALIGLIAVIGALNASLLVSPIGLFTVAIIALLLILEDLAVYSSGGDSLFGHLMNNSEGFRNAMERLFGVFNNIGPVLQDVWRLFQAVLHGDWSTVDEITAKWGLLGAAINVVLRFLSDFKDMIISVFRGDWSHLDELTAKWGLLGDAINVVLRGLSLLSLNPSYGQATGAALTALPRAIQQQASGDSEGAQETLQAANRSIFNFVESGANRIGLGGVFNWAVNTQGLDGHTVRESATGSTTTINQTNNFDINSTDPMGASDEIARELERINAELSGAH